MPSSKKCSTKTQRAAKKAQRMTKFTTQTCRQIHKGSFQTAIDLGFAQQTQAASKVRGNKSSVLMRGDAGLIRRAFS